MQPVYYLFVCVPVAILLDAARAGAPAVFFVSALSVIPAAALIGSSTDELSSRAGPGIAGLINVTFGNVPELLIAAFALRSGLDEFIKAALVGSLIGNALLVLGTAMFAGGCRRTSLDR